MHLLPIILIGCLTIAIVPSTCLADLSKAEKASISLGLDAGEKVIKFISEFGDKNNKELEIFTRLGKLSGFLGATGGLISFALSFLPSQDSKELAFMKNKFQQVNSKLDIITAKLDNVDSLITFENQRAIYVRSATKINVGHEKLLAILDELQKVNCSRRSLCQRRKSRIASNYVKYFAVKYNLHEILHGVTRKTSVFGDPLLSVVQHHFKCSIPKIDQFANGVLRLAFKAQQVILAHEKLLGSKQSITQSMNEWLSLIYKLRMYRNKLRNYCYKNVLRYMNADLANKKYQRVSSSSQANDQVNRMIKKLFDKRYSWLAFTVYSYNAWGSTWHSWKANSYGTTIWYSPASRQARKRNIFVSFVDKKSTYTKRRYVVSWALDHVARTLPLFHYYNYRYVRNIVDIFARRLKRARVWKYIASINIRKKEDSFMITSDNPTSYIRKIYSLKYYRIGIHGRMIKRVGRIYVVVTLNSMRQAHKHCHLKCKNKGLCKIKPYSSQCYCECKPYYQGATCEQHSNALLAKTIDSMLAVTLKLPHLSDISFDIKDLREFVGVSFVRLQWAISSLDASFENKRSQLSRKVEWASLVTQYSVALNGIQYFAQTFALLNHYNKTTAEFQKIRQKLAHAVLKDRAGIQRYLFDLNTMLIGVKGSLLGHKPFLLIFMESKAGKPCTPAYKKAVDNCWKQLVLLQQVGYFVWTQALGLTGQATNIVDYLYKKRVKGQLSVMKKSTCEYKVKHSANIQCTGGFYLNPSMKIRNTCMKNYYVTGSLTTSCKRKVSGCKQCGCSFVGSRSQQCSDTHGKCQCKRLYYGKKCTSRDCVWKNWSAFGQCLGCGYRAKRTSSRSVQTPKLGNGKSCQGSSVMHKKCFKGCCKNQFHCSNTRKCIRKSLQCNYDNDCGDMQDERNCKEKCSILFGNKRNGSIKDSIAPCDGLLNGFRLVWAEYHIRWSTKCCMPFALNTFQLRRVLNPWTSYTKVYHLSKQAVNCKRNSLLRSFRIAYRRPGKVRFEYVCLDRRVHSKRFKCVWKYTSWGWDAQGKVANVLTYQIFDCPPRYSINYFRMKNRPGKWRFHYRCCRIQP
eukprot:Seg4309.2 transcript_id=Seg4309.2/GoldUCD/mRNA.D3Y31 product="Complement component C9" protein_id=Seg4309.2/GoldUCD/D3Y31